MEFSVEQELAHNLELWTKRKRSGISHKAKDWDERSLGWVKELKEDKKRAERSRARVEATCEYLVKRGLLGENDNVIDIGCGPGQFVCDFAKTAGHVTGTDISPKMCEAGAAFADAAGLKNTSFVPCDFNSVNLDEMGWRNQFDLVFSSITPALSSYENLLKSMEMSRGYCFQSNFIKVTDSLNDVVLPEILPPEMMPAERNLRSFYTLFNILLLNGKEPETMYYKEMEDEIIPVDDRLIAGAYKFAPHIPDTDEMRLKIRDAFLTHADKDGNVSVHREWHYGWILWRV